MGRPRGNRRGQAADVSLGLRYDLSTALGETDNLGANFFPDRGLVRLRDAETGHVRVFDAADKEFRAAWGRFRSSSPYPDPLKVFRSAGVDAIPLRTDAPYESRLVRFFKERERRKGAGR